MELLTVVEVKGRRWWWFGCGHLGTMLVVAIWLWWAVEAVVVAVMVAWLALWLRGAMLFVVIWLLRYGWSKITIEKEKPTSKGHSPVNTKNSL